MSIQKHTHTRARSPHIPFPLWMSMAPYVNTWPEVVKRTSVASFLCVHFFITQKNEQKKENNFGL